MILLQSCVNSCLLPLEPGISFSEAVLFIAMFSFCILGLLGGVQGGLTAVWWASFRISNLLMHLNSASCWRISIVSSNTFLTVAPKESPLPCEYRPDSMFKLRVIAVESYAFDTCPKVVSAFGSSLKGLDIVTDGTATWSLREGGGVMSEETLDGRLREKFYSAINTTKQRQQDKLWTRTMLLFDVSKILITGRRNI